MRKRRRRLPASISLTEVAPKQNSRESILRRSVRRLRQFPPLRSRSYPPACAAGFSKAEGRGEPASPRAARQNSCHSLFASAATRDPEPLTTALAAGRRTGSGRALACVVASEAPALGASRKAYGAAFFSSARNDRLRSAESYSARPIAPVPPTRRPTREPPPSFPPPSPRSSASPDPSG